MNLNLPPPPFFPSTQPLATVQLNTFIETNGPRIYQFFDEVCVADNVELEDPFEVRGGEKGGGVLFLSAPLFFCLRLPFLPPSEQPPFRPLFLASAQVNDEYYRAACWRIYDHIRANYNEVVGNMNRMLDLAVADGDNAAAQSIRQVR